MRLGKSRQTVGEEPHLRKPSGLRQDPLVSTLPGKFTVIEEIGRGGMGVVYRARHELTGTDVAIKVLSSTLASDSDSVRRFVREARVAMLIDSENIVRVLDMDVTTEDRLFLVMEYLKGRTLQDLIDENQLTWKRAMPIILQVCSALGAAHAKGIIHRDLKPENVFLIERNGIANFVKVLDFGLAKFLDLGRESGQLTAVGVALGTPHFMSPEQALGRLTDHRSDIYALGIIMYEMLTGRVPFSDPSNAAVLDMQINQQPRPPSELCPEISPVIEAIILRALEKDPTKRFQSVDELVDAINESDEEKTTVFGGVQRDTTTMRTTLRSPVYRYIGGVAAAAAVAVAIVSGLVIFNKPGRTERTVVAVAETEQREVERIVVPEPAVQEDVLIVIRSTPAGASVLIGGKKFGETPTGIKLPKSDQPSSITVSLDGYQTQVRDVTPNGDTTTINLRLEQNRPVPPRQRPKPTQRGTKVKVVDPY